MQVMLILTFFNVQYLQNVVLALKNVQIVKFIPPEKFTPNSSYCMENTSILDSHYQ